MSENDDTTKLTVTINKTLRRKLRVYAASNDLSVNQVVVSALVDFFIRDDHAKAEVTSATVTTTDRTVTGQP